MRVAVMNEYSVQNLVYKLLMHLVDLWGLEYHGLSVSNS